MNFEDSLSIKHQRMH